MSVDSVDIPKVDVASLKTYPGWIYGAENYDGKTVPKNIHYGYGDNKKTPNTLDEAIENHCVAFVANGRSVYDLNNNHTEDPGVTDEIRLDNAKKAMDGKPVVFTNRLFILNDPIKYKEEYFYYPEVNLTNDLSLLDEKSFNKKLEKIESDRLYDATKHNTKALKDNKTLFVDEKVKAEMESSSQTAPQKSLFSLPSLTSFFGNKSTSGGKRKSKKSKKSKSQKTKKSKSKKSKK